MRWRDFWRVGGIVAGEFEVVVEMDLDLDLDLGVGLGLRLVFEGVGVVFMEIVGEVAILRAALVELALLS